MKEFRHIEIDLLNIQLGCILRLARLKKGLSQQELSLVFGSNSTMIGRIERSENFSSWDKIYSMSQYLNVDYCSLFNLMSKDELLSIVEESLNLEEKLTQKKREYYFSLKTTITDKYKELEKGA
ncbi:helix-turn-helix domain-containing protein [Gelidibacter maritimus]|uniref:Helix-turn-helix transcriptional regulator n=1 Tax=Gelidibacter maritimus TaxID=2761487 RepID=A0A7W2M4U5_9FLAO|nr:helix-turn-helix transcriptional regulator [Gelidibacter maritimus]MBA6152703.1 helix-turn-helix transcriptional regulator [Gelidibacter maritimus]